MKLLATALALFAALPAFAGAPLLVSPAQLDLREPHLVILQVGDAAAFLAGHLPNAEYAAFDTYATARSGADDVLKAELLPPAALRANFEKLGISDSSHVVVVYDDAKNLTDATRLLFTLEYLGLGEQESMLDGGLPEWKREGKPLATAVTAAVPGHLTPREPAPLLADHNVVKRMYKHDGMALVDARAREFYSGEQATYGKAGHIPGAVNVPFTELLNGHPTIDVANLKAAYAEAGIKPGDTVVTYCHIGMQASAALFGARLLGHPVLLYDGSFQDWATQDRGPVVKSVQ